MQLKKEAFEAGVKNTFYIGNGRYQTPKVEDATEQDINNLVDDADDLDF